MTTQVQHPVPEPHAEPVPQGSLSSPPKKNGAVNEEMLSPVSKLELARKFAAEEQQKRIEQACERVVKVKKTELVEEISVEQTVTENGSVKRTGLLSSFAKRVASVVKSSNDENNANTANTQPEDDEAGSPTRQLLRATRNKLNAIVSKTEEQEPLPATNYHLKQMGLADDKVNIYASLDEQKNELRRRRESAIRCQEKYMQEHAELNDAGYKSGEDSDFAPEEEEEDSDDDLSDWEVDQEELRGLIQDQSEFVHNIETLKKYKRAAKRKAALKRLRPVGTAAFVVLALLLLALSIAVAEHQSGFCRALVSQTPPAEETRIVTCGAVLRLHDALLAVLHALPSLP